MIGRKKVIVAGHSCLDITPIFPAGGVSDTEKLLTPGRLLQMDGADINAGGAVSNTGIAMKLLGTDVSLLTKTGTDAFGKILTGIYKDYGVADGVMAAAGERTSYSVVLAPPGIDRIFLHDPGANNTFSCADVKKADLKGTVLFHFGYPPLMERMYENNGAELVEMLKYVKAQGIATSLDLAFADADSAAGRADWKRILAEALPYVDFFVPSVEELCCMLNYPMYQEWEKRAAKTEIVNVLNREKDIRPLAQTCIDLGVSVLMLKCGAPGIYYKTAGKEKMEEVSRITGLDPMDWACREGFEAGYLADRVRSAAGAGDTTIAAFLAAMLDDRPFENCIRLAAAQGASCVAEYGALGGLKTLEELENRITAGWKKWGE